MQCKPHAAKRVVSLPSIISALGRCFAAVQVWHEEPRSADFVYVFSLFFCVSFAFFAWLELCAHWSRCISYPFPLFLLLHVSRSVLILVQPLSTNNLSYNKYYHKRRIDHDSRLLWYIAIRMHAAVGLRFCTALLAVKVTFHTAFQLH